MAFSNGTYSLYTPGNPVTTGTTIASTWANSTFNDIATALTSLGTSVATALVATGTIQSDALQVTSVLNSVATVAAGTGVKLSSTAALDSQTKQQIIYNGGANALKVYPASGQNINSLAANAYHYLAPKSSCQYFLVSTTQWIANLSA